MRRIIHLADAHEGKNQYGLRARADDYHAAFAATMDQAQRGDLVLIAGDLFDSREPGPLAYRRVKQVLEEMAHRGVSVIAVEGNHDRLLHDDVGRTWMHVLHEEQMLHVLGRDGEPEIINLDDLRIVGFPYRGHKEKEALEQVRAMLEPLERISTILLCHVGVVDVAPTMGGLTTAADFDPLRPYISYVATGHFHATWDNGFVHCPGSLEPTSISEDNGGYYYIHPEEELVGFVPLRDYHTPRRIIKGQRVGSLEELRHMDWEGAIVQLTYTGPNLPSLDQIQAALADHPPLKILPAYDVRDEGTTTRQEDQALGEIERQIFVDLLGEEEAHVAQQLKLYALDGETAETIAEYVLEAAC